MLNSLLATLYASQRLWERGCSNGEAQIVSVPVSGMQFAQLAPGVCSSRDTSKEEPVNVPVRLGESLHDMETEEKVITISGSCVMDLSVSHAFESADATSLITNLVL